MAEQHIVIHMRNGDQLVGDGTADQVQLLIRGHATWSGTYTIVNPTSGSRMYINLAAVDVIEVREAS